MKAETTRKRQDREQMRSLILDAARELFGQGGYEAVTMRQVADRIEYTPTTIYSYFKDKESLLKELCARDFHALRAAFEQIAGEPDPIERLRQIGHAYLRFALEHPSHYRLMFMTLHDIDPDDIGIEKGNPDQDAYAFLLATVESAMVTGRVRPEFDDAELLAQALWGGLHGVIALDMTHAHDPWIDWRPIERRARLVLDTLIDGFCRRG